MQNCMFASIIVYIHVAILMHFCLTFWISEHFHNDMNTQSINPDNKEDMLSSKSHMSTFTISKNLAIISTGFLLLFTSFNSLSNLQSTLNKEEALGTVGLSVIYCAGVLSCLFLPSFVIGNLGCKWTIALSMVCYVVYMGANFHAVWGTLVPASIIIGIGASTLWSATSTYLTQIAVWYAELTQRTTDEVTNTFFGFFYMFFQTSQIWGNLISSTVFKTKSSNDTQINLHLCGANFDPKLPTNSSNLARPSDTKVYMLCSIYLGCAFLAFFVIATFLDNINLDVRNNYTKRKISLSVVMSTFRHWWYSRPQKMLTILTIYSGIEVAFITGDYTKSYVSCALGIWNVGNVMICFGTVNAVCSFVFGRLVRVTGHTPLFVLALWAIGDAVMQSQFNAFYGYLFFKDKVAAFSNRGLWESVGFIIAFAWSGYLVTNVKLGLCLGFLISGMTLYILVDVQNRKQRKQVKINEDTIALLNYID
ncbi:protein unc-93 homolog A-like isoform X2 [Mytilus californianus]|uniref:protein unc-93 homolog A-like isoform X2 n=1 Tax=Mytilus californianus TaxID=6549 RepID=UPI002247EC3A|nr:protein unc-93 homolog A-like isoform X2 [Mytilus californianus]